MELFINNKSGAPIYDQMSASCGLSREELREMLELLWEG